jgi:hypothetical protein
MSSVTQLKKTPNFYFFHQTVVFGLPFDLKPQMFALDYRN